MHKKRGKKITRSPSLGAHNMEISSNNEDDIRIFGRHTILVHSVLMFLILSFMLMLLSICVMNFLHYTPKFLQDHIMSIRGSASSLHAHPNQDNIALGEEVDFTNDTDRPVKINISETAHWQNIINLQMMIVSSKWESPRYTVKTYFLCKQKEGDVNQMIRKTNPCQ